MNKSKRRWIKAYGFTRRSWNEIRVLVNRVAKDARRDYDRIKSKHTVEERWNKGHKAWSIEGERTT